MELTFSIPTPKTISHETSRDTRLQIHTLYYYGNWSPSDIALQLNLSYAQVTSKQRCGRKPLLNTPSRRQIISWITSSASNRRIPIYEIAHIWNLSDKTIRKALKKEGYASRFARRKPPISETNRELRLQWAIEHKDWTLDQWSKMLWTDETWVNPGKHTRTRIIRKIGLSEVYHPDCIENKWQRKIGWMCWGGISGKYGKGPFLFWEKKWGTINGQSYCERILPILSAYLQLNPGLLFQQDNYGGHKSFQAQTQLAALNIQPISWPAFSPDLNPIETVWSLIKDYIQMKDPTVNRSYKRLRILVTEAWESITIEKIQEIIATMPERCKAVIEANGMYTKY